MHKKLEKERKKKTNKEAQNRILKRETCLLVFTIVSHDDYYLINLFCVSKFPF